MTTKTTTLILSLFAVLLLVLTNPTEEAHKAAVKAKANDFVRTTIEEEAKKGKASGIADGLTLLFGNFAMDKLIELSIHRNNYLLFSTTTFTREKETKVIGVGLLGNVWLSPKVDEAMRMK